jgi:hypothetical protein
MNSKKAKALRRIAREDTEGSPAAHTVQMRNGQSINAPNTQRGFYRLLKKYQKKPSEA